jgi:hypothetical protein
MLSQKEEAAAFIMRKRRMEPVKKMPFAEFTIQWKEIALIGNVESMSHASTNFATPQTVRNVHFVLGHRAGIEQAIDLAKRRRANVKEHHVRGRRVLGRVPWKCLILSAVEAARGDQER